MTHNGKGWRFTLCKWLGYAGILSAEGNLTDYPLPEPLHIPKLTIREEVKIDGVLDEDFWKKATKFSQFVGRQGETALRESTELYLGYDDKWLYLAWVVEDSDIRATMTERDSHFWEEEVVEFFFTAEGLNTYFEFQWNPLGGVFDAVIRNWLREDGTSRQFKGDWSYTSSGMEHAVVMEGKSMDTTVKDKGWTVEVRIPFSDLGRSTPEPGEVWRGNFFRINRFEKDAEEYSCWSPVMHGNFHQPVRFGYLIFGDDQND